MTVSAKLIGAVFIIAASSGIGFCFSVKLKEKAEKLRTAEEFFKVAESEVLYTMLPSAEIICRLAKDEVFDGFCAVKICAKMCERGIGFPNAWEEGIKVFEKEVSLTKGEKETLENFGNIFGRYDIESQIKGIKGIEERISGYRKSAEKEYFDKGKLYRRLGVLFGAGVVAVII